MPRAKWAFSPAESYSAVVADYPASRAHKLQGGEKDLPECLIYDRMRPWVFVHNMCNNNDLVWKSSVTDIFAV